MAIAFLFLIVKEFNNPEIWKKFFELTKNNTKYTIYIHQKENVDIGYFNKFKLEKTVPTKWGDISLVVAMNLLLEEAMKNEENEHFIFLSESCCPVKSINYIYDFLEKDFSYVYNKKVNNSHITKYLEPKNRQYITWASQWSILCRKHAKTILENTHILDWFKSIPYCAPDEYVYMFILNMFHKNEYKVLMTTYHRFLAKNMLGYFKKTMSNPVETYILDYYELKTYIENPTTLFIRKVCKNCFLQFYGYQFNDTITKLYTNKVKIDIMNIPKLVKYAEKNNYNLIEYDQSKCEISFSLVNEELSIKENINKNWSKSVIIPMTLETFMCKNLEKQ